MSSSMDKRLAALEVKDQARMERVYTRVLGFLSDDEREHFFAVVKRHRADTQTWVSDDEKRALCHVEALTHADPEMRPGDLMNIPQAWMQEYGYDPQ